MCSGWDLWLWMVMLIGMGLLRCMCWGRWWVMIMDWGFVVRSMLRLISSVYSVS